MKGISHTNALTEYAYEIWQLLQNSDIVQRDRYNLVAEVNPTAVINGLVFVEDGYTFPISSLNYTIPEWTEPKLEIMLNSLLPLGAYSKVLLAPNGSYFIYLINVLGADYSLDIGTDIIIFDTVPIAS